MRDGRQTHWVQRMMTGLRIPHRIATLGLLAKESVCGLFAQPETLAAVEAVVDVYGDRLIAKQHYAVLRRLVTAGEKWPRKSEQRYKWKLRA